MTLDTLRRLLSIGNWVSGVATLASASEWEGSATRVADCRIVVILGPAALLISTSRRIL